MSGCDPYIGNAVPGGAGTPSIPSPHAPSHQDGGSDEINVAGLSGLLAEAQTPLGHKLSHQNGGGDEISVVGLSGLLADAQTPLAHKLSHQDGGGDEISVVGLSGLLADAQTPLAHKLSHQDGGGDEISVAGLSGLLADPQNTNITLDGAYDNDGGAASINVDAGSLTWNLSGTNSFLIDTSGASGIVEGFKVLNGTDYFRVINQAVDRLDVEGELRTINIALSGFITLNAVSALSLDAGNNSYIKIEAGDLDISTNTSGDITITAAGALNLITPTIADFTNAGHDHANAAGGGSVLHASLGSIGANDHHDRSHTMISTLDHTAGTWKIFYTDGSGNVQELANGASSLVLTSNGAAAAPSWQ